MPKPILGYIGYMVQWFRVLALIPYRASWCCIYWLQGAMVPGVGSDSL